jgi:hypothetical protein
MKHTADHSQKKKLIEHTAPQKHQEIVEEIHFMSVEQTDRDRMKINEYPNIAQK